MRPRFLDFVYTFSVCASRWETPAIIIFQAKQLSQRNNINNSNKLRRKKIHTLRAPARTRRGNNISHHHQKDFFFCFFSAHVLLFLGYPTWLHSVVCVSYRRRKDKRITNPFDWSVKNILNCCPPPVLVGVRFQHYNSFFFFSFGRHIIFRFTEKKEKKTIQTTRAIIQSDFFSSSYLLLGVEGTTRMLKTSTVTGTDPEISKKMGR